MLTCPKCQSDSPDGMRFCLQCGGSLAPLSPPMGIPRRAEGPAPPKETATVPLRIAPTPVMAPRGGEYRRPSLRDGNLEIDEEAFKRSFARPGVPAGAIVCRFCKGPLDLSGDFCEQCGAPVVEAAPPGAVQPKPQPAVPPPPAPPPSKPVQTSPPAPTWNSTPPTQSRPGIPPGAPRSSPTPTRTPTPVIPPPPPNSPEEPSSGLMGRLKGIFKKS